jgi:hypothetical protein
MKKLNPRKAMFCMLVLLVITGSALAQTTLRPASRSKAAVVAEMKGRKLEFAREKSILQRHVQSVIDEADKGTVVKDLYLRTIAKKNYLGLRLGRGDEITGTLFLDLVPSSQGAAGKYILGPGYTYCTSGACKSCEPTGKGGCFCATDPLVGIYAQCYMRPVIGQLANLEPPLTHRLLDNGFEAVEDVNPRNATDKKASTRDRRPNN